MQISEFEGKYREEIEIENITKLLKIADLLFTDVLVLEIAKKSILQMRVYFPPKC